MTRTEIDALFRALTWGGAPVQGTPEAVVRDLDPRTWVELLQVPPFAARLITAEASPAFRARTVASLAAVVSAEAAVAPGIIPVATRARSAWPDADWTPFRKALRAKVRMQRHHVRASEEAPTLFQLFLLYWDRLTRKDLVLLFRQFSRKADQQTITRHPKADVEFWRTLIRSYDGPPTPTNVLEMAAHFECCRTDPELRAALLAGRSSAVLYTLVLATRDPDKLAEIIDAAMKMSPSTAFIVLDAVPSELRRGLAHVLMPLLEHSSRDVRFRAQQMLMGARYHDLPRAMIR